MPLLSIVRPGEGYTEERIYGRDKALLAILNGSGADAALCLFELKSPFPGNRIS
jgi:hypothetical protein